MVIARDVAGIWDRLATIADPEIPVLSITDLGIVREVGWLDDETLDVAITPTYSGCPATRAIERAITDELVPGVASKLRIRTVLDPAWTTDFISPAAAERLRAYGIAPPSKADRVIMCPRCGAGETERISRFGSTPCKELRRCLACREPFDYFKCH